MRSLNDSKKRKSGDSQGTERPVKQRMCTTKKWATVVTTLTDKFKWIQSIVLDDRQRRLLLANSEGQVFFLDLKDHSVLWAIDKAGVKCLAMVSSHFSDRCNKLTLAVASRWEIKSDEDYIGYDDANRFYEGVVSSSDGKMVFFTHDRNCNMVLCIDRHKNQIRVVAGDGDCNEKDGPAEIASFTVPINLCFDTRTAIPESALFVRTAIGIRRLQLQTSANQIFRYHIRAMCSDRVLSSLVRDLWLIISEYLSEPAIVTTCAKISYVHALTMLPNGYLLISHGKDGPTMGTSISSGCTLSLINPATGSQCLIAGKQSVQKYLDNKYVHRDGEGLLAEFQNVGAIALDEANRSAYLADFGIGIRHITLPQNYFIPCPRL